MIEQITDQNSIISIIIRANYKEEGISFFTPTDFSQQLGYMNRPKGYVIKPHYHNTIERNIILTQEVLYIKKGKLKVDFYTEVGKYLESSILETGDVILLASGAHGFEALDEIEVIEIKQGPYHEKGDKIHFSNHLV